MSSFLTTKLSTVRARYRSVALGTGASFAILTLIAALTLGILLDWWLDLPRWTRAALLTLDAGLVAYVLFRKTIRPFIATPDDDAVALRVEDAHPRFASRLISAIQLSRPQALGAGASAAFVRATLAEAEAIAAKVDFTGVISTESLTRAFISAIAAVMIGLTLFLAGLHDHISPDLVARAFLSDVPVPRKTRVDVTSGDLRLGRGDTATLSALARGVIPATGSVDVRFNSGRKQSFSIDPTPADKSAFARTLDNVQDSFDYRVRLGDTTTRWFHADVLTPPVVTAIEVRQVYPAYTHLSPVVRSLGDLSLLTGSHLLIKATSNNALASSGNVVKLVNPTTQPAVPLVSHDHDVTGDVPLPPKTTGFSVHLKDANNLTSRDPTVYRIDLIADKPPTVKVNLPLRQEELVTRTAKVLIGFDAADDFGIAKLTLKYKIDDGPDQAIPFDVTRSGNPQPRSLHEHYTFALSKLTPPSATQPTLEGSTVEYWLEVEDNNDVTGPGRGASEHYSARIVTEAEKRAEMFARIGAVGQDIERGADDEVKLHKDLGDAILERK